MFKRGWKSFCIWILFAIFAIQKYEYYGDTEEI